MQCIDVYLCAASNKYVTEEKAVEASLGDFFVRVQNGPGN